MSIKELVKNNTKNELLERTQRFAYADIEDLVN